MRRFGLFYVLVLVTAAPGLAKEKPDAKEANEPASEYPSVLEPIESAPGAAPLFPFRITRGAPDNVTNVQTWAGPWAPAGQDGFVQTDGSRFVTARGPRRFSGTNICFTGCFPEHDQAEKVAADLARFGINLVRLHYVHHKFPPDKVYASPDSFIEPIQLEKFDYLFDQLKRRGIYVYMQLNIARKFGAASGFENADKLPWYNNGLDNIEPRMIALQKKYVRDLLTHVNPYTGLAYKDDPAIATLELANENSIVVKWYQGTLDHLPSPYQEQFQALWNDWLRKKYHDTASLSRAWGCRNDPLGDEMIPDGRFPHASGRSKYKDWGFQNDDQSRGGWTIVPGDREPMAGRNVARLTIERIGKTPNIPQFYVRFGVSEGVQYNLSFKLRVSQASSVSVRVSQDHAPYQVCGWRETVAATDAWREYSCRFRTNMTDPKVRLVFANFAPGVTVELADVSLRPGGPTGLEAGETLEDGSVPLPKPSGPIRLHMPGILADMSDFLFDCEDAYFQQMRRVVKEDVRASQPVTGTQLAYGFWSPMGRMDYCDIHSYWCHPAAPGGGSWTNPKIRDYWFVRNMALVDCQPERSTIAQLAIKRIVNRPYTVSEYDHAYPNFYAAEGNLMLFALGAFQDWSAIMHFAWSHNDEYDPEMMKGYFDMKCNPVKQVHFPACYAMFTRGDVHRGPGHYRYLLPLSQTQEREMQARSARPNLYQQSPLLLQPQRDLTLAVYSGVDLTDLAVRPPEGLAPVKAVSSWSDLPESMGSPERKWIRNEFGELYWNFDTDSGAYFTVDTPGTKLFTGFVRDRAFPFHGLTIRPGKTLLDWTTISLVRTSGPAASDKAASSDAGLAPGRYLLAATGLMHNRGAVWKQVASNLISGAKGYQGSNGTAPVLCEGIPATLSLKVPPAKVKLFVLDQNGDRARPLPVRGSDAEAQVEIGPQHQTLWYELVVE